MSQKRKLYHCTTISGLKELTPRISTHGKSYVYATENKILSLLFGSYKSYGDFDGMYGINKQGKPYFYEAYSGALKRRFEDVIAYLYELDPTNFKEGKTSFSAEVVSELPVKVLSCSKIENMYNYLLELINKGEIDYREWSLEDKELTRYIDAHIYHRFKMFKIYENPESNIYKFCCYKFPQIVEKIEYELKK